MKKLIALVSVVFAFTNMSAQLKSTFQWECKY